ncbi:hypothetical protein [Pengzhenrongella frigida]|uniref:RAMA domain-containing protein n=1 Tax=Pengzhenrongella frigida TaxID=1259133 RepID=A0A4Q5N0J8_9MICO|nr:hypothetical protein [Cellulomonas sp. HLT2-17]RYV51546.1 hypothetical protein EUA98_08160 [Cellulomonas sp. HLT2-17]
MPIFELDAGHPVLVQPMQPAAGTFPADTSSVVADHLESLLGEPLFPIATRQPGADGPHLLAVDAAGQPVVVEVVQMLDSEGIVRALRFAGAAARLSSADLARSYHGGPERFATDLVAFRENVPVAVAHSAARHAGARLLLVCSEVAESVVDAVEFLRQPGRQVEVLQVGVLRGADGRRFLDVSPLIPLVPKRRAVEPSALQRVGAEPVAPAPVAPEPRVLPVLSPAPAFARDAGHDGQRSASHGPPSPHGPAHPGAGRGESWPTSDRRRHHRETSPTPPPVVVRVPVEQVVTGQIPIGPISTGPVPSAGASAPSGTFPSVLTVPVGPVAAAAVPDPMLAALAGELATATTLVWSRQRRGQRFVATLRPDGLIQLPDGAVFADPDEAASAAAGSEYSVDGWRMWRVGDDGPALAELRDV